MYRILSTGKSGLTALQKKLDLISNNVANSQTDGYKKLETNFESLLNNSIKTMECLYRIMPDREIRL